MSLVAPGEAGRGEVVLRQLELAVTRRLDGLLQGDHQGLVPGAGNEPGESREYRPGDDVRRMDWNVTARTTIPYVLQTVADRELETWVAVDVSASLDFGTARCEKRDLAVAAVAAVGFLTARSGNRLGALLMEPGATVTMPPRQGRDAVRAVLTRLLRQPRADTSAGPVDLAGGLKTLGRLARRRGLVVVVSDFLAPVAPEARLGTDGWERHLRALAVRHEVLAVEAVDPRELELPDVGFLTLVDPETGRLLDVQTSNPKLRRRFAEAAEAQRSAVRQAIRRSGAEHLVLRTDRDWLLDVVRWVIGRRRRRSGLPGGVR